MRVFSWSVFSFQLRWNDCILYSPTGGCYGLDNLETGWDHGALETLTAKRLLIHKLREGLWVIPKAATGGDKWSCDSRVVKLPLCKMVIHFVLPSAQVLLLQTWRYYWDWFTLPLIFPSSTACSVTCKQCISQFLAFIKSIILSFSLFCSSPATISLIFSGNLNRGKIIFLCRFYLIMLKQ